MLHYSKPGAACQSGTRENASSPLADQPAEVTKKINRRHVKSAYRDARFRPLFQALQAYDAVAASGGTSVTYATPSHPSYPVIQLNTSHTLTPTSAYVPEALTDEEHLRDARYWRAFLVKTVRNYQTPAEWRDLSDIGRLEWFHHGLRSLGPVSGFTLNFSDDVEAQVRRQAKSADWLSKRIARRLKDALGRKVPFWFTFEVSPAPERRLHVHGELQASENELEVARKALRLAGGEWHDARQHQAHTKPDLSAVWSNYAAKDAIWTRPLSGRLKNLSRPINGDWYYAGNAVRSAAEKLYTSRHKQVMVLLSSVKSARK